MRPGLMFICGAAILVTGCGPRPQPPSLGGTGPAFDPIAFFDGHIRSWGVMEERSGAPTGWIVTDCQGHPEGADHLRMVQHLSFQDAPAQDRIWSVWRTGPERYEATANDMVGSAKGIAVGKTFHWSWVLASSSGQRPFDVTMDQWMYRLDDGSAMIRTTISKFGIVLAEVSERFARTDAAAETNVGRRTPREPAG